MKRTSGMVCVLVIFGMACASNSKMARISAVRELKDPASQEEAYNQLSSNFDLNQKEQITLIKSIFKSRLSDDAKARSLTQLASQPYFSQKSLVYLVKRLPRLKSTSEPVKKNLMKTILAPPVE